MTDAERELLLILGQALLMPFQPVDFEKVRELLPAIEREARTADVEACR